ncbi:MAG TPA: DUF1015 domain-containing protein [Kofleriaceae bacterium]|nr:DUF1015 domain-containing protein [Kofleriaceae bacterium]
MLDIAGFRGLTYDPAKVDLSHVITPPYDVINADQRAALAERSPYNFVRIDLPEQSAAHADRYRSAADTLAGYQASGILRQDTARSLYRYHQEFTDRERQCRVVRKGVLAAVALSPWSAGVIRPHEHTFKAAREDRMRMLEATRVHLSPVFATYEDDARDVERLLEAATADASGPPDLVGTTDDGTRHSVWRISDPATIAEVSRLLAAKHAYVLDGHHRYETMVAFREREAGSPVTERGLMFLVPMNDPGLIILPTHRLIHGVAGLSRDGFLAAAAPHCRIERVAGAARDAAQLRAAMTAASPGPVFAAAFPGDPDAHLLIFPDDAGALEPEVAVLHRVVLERMLGVTGGAEGQPKIRYVSDTAATLDEIAAGRAQLALLVRPPPLAQIKQLSDLGRVMPQKSTYFFPKLASGLVMMPLDP